MSKRNLPPDQMICPECGGIAESDSVDVGVGLMVRGNFFCPCGWDIDADGRINVASYDDYFVESDPAVPGFTGQEPTKRSDLNA